MTADQLRTLIRRGRDLNAELKEKAEELNEIKAALIAAGAGEHLGTDGSKALVIYPAPAIKPDDVAIAAVKRKVGPKRFAKLFVETLIVSPVKAFREVANAILDTEDAEGVIRLCEKESSPQVRFS
jgi:hypothetical protein